MPGEPLPLADRDAGEQPGDQVLLLRFAVDTCDAASLSPATPVMIELVGQHMRMAHREYQP